MKIAMCFNGSRDEFRESFLESKPMPMELVDRDICEKVENKRLQIIPYILIYSVSDEMVLHEPTPDERSFYYKVTQVLAYRRSKGGNEQRLHDLYSVGLGGHIELMLMENKNSGVYVALSEVGKEIPMTLRELKSTLELTILQELNEEIGLDLSEDYIFQVTGLVPGPDLPESHLDDAARVHQSVFVFIRIPDVASLINDLDPDDREVEELQVIDIETPCVDFEQTEAMLRECYPDYDFEPWSISALHKLQNTRTRLLY